MKPEEINIPRPWWRARNFCDLRVVALARPSTVTLYRVCCRKSWHPLLPHSSSSPCSLPWKPLCNLQPIISDLSSFLQVACKKLRTPEQLLLPSKHLRREATDCWLLRIYIYIPLRGYARIPRISYVHTSKFSSWQTASKPACEELLLVLVYSILYTYIVFWESGKAATTVCGRSAFLRASRAASCEVSGLRLVGTTACCSFILLSVPCRGIYDMRVYDT